MSQKKSDPARFADMNLSPDVLAALQAVRYDTPTPIQSLTIPHMVSNKDLIGQARTGTGKTAAFALPLLSRIDLENKRPQVLVLTPTRELAIQVAQSFRTYGAGMKGLNVLAIYGGQGYDVQLNQLKRGVHVVVGTPGRLMDHIRRKTVSFADLTGLVLDEADEMLHMGFIDDVEWILSKTPANSQIALFSATMPPPIRRIAGRYLKNPEEIIVRHEADVMSTINQKFWIVKGAGKASALVRILEAAAFDGVIVFTKTRTATVEVTRILEENGFRAEALNGDIAQAARERTVNRLKNGHIDILVATDVAARGLDVDRISHVINYDMPPKTEPYIHRIGRTGRAGRAGEAVLFVQRNERWMLKKIETATRQKVEEMILPSNRDINEKRIAGFKKTILQTIATENLDGFTDLIETVAREQEIPVVRVAAALARLSQGSRPLFLPEKAIPETVSPKPENGNKPQQSTCSGSGRKKTTRPGKSVKLSNQGNRKNPPRIPMNGIRPAQKGMERYRIEVGSKHGLKPGDIVGAISNEAGLESRFIGSINIDYDHSLVDLPFGMPGDIFHLLKKTWVRSREMSISKCAC